MYLPPKEVELATSVLALIADPKAAKVRLDALTAASAEYDSIRLSLRDQTLKNEKEQKQLAEDRKVLEDERAQLDERFAVELPKLSERERALTLREDALSLQLTKQKQDLASLQSKEDKLAKDMKDREIRVQGREDDVAKRENTVLARENEVKSRLAKLKAATE